MAAQSIASRSRTARGMSDTDDAFVARALEFSAWARKNARLIIAAALVALVAIGGVLYYRAYQAGRLERAATEFMRLEQTVASGNTQLAVRDLGQFIQRYGGTPYADEARVLLGQLHLQAGQAQQAIAALAPAVDDVDESPLAAQAALLLGSARLQAGDQAAAIQSYLDVAENARFTYQRQEALTSAALLREQTGDYRGAAELYRRLVDTADPGSLQRSVYEMRLAEAEGRAQAQ